MVFNAVEPTNASDILLNSLMLTIYGPTGTFVFTATGGFETFFAASAGTTVTPVPEPETYALMPGGLGALSFVL